eukprot:g14956.t1
MAPLFFSKLGAATATFAGHLMTVDYVGVTAVEVLTLIRQQREQEKQAGGIAIPNEKAENKKDGGLLLSKAPKLKQNEVGRKGSETQTADDIDKCPSGWMDYINGDFWLGDLCDIPLLDVVSYWDDEGKDFLIDQMQALVSKVNPKNHEKPTPKESRHCVEAINKAKELYIKRAKFKDHINANFGRSAHFSEPKVKNHREDLATGEERFEHKVYDVRAADRADSDGIWEADLGENLEWLCKLVCSEMRDSCVAYSYSLAEYTARPQYCWIKSDKHKQTDAVMKQHIMSSTCVKRVENCDDATIDGNGRLKTRNVECEAKVNVQHPE